MVGHLEWQRKQLRPFDLLGPVCCSDSGSSSTLLLEKRGSCAHLDVSVLGKQTVLVELPTDHATAAVAIWYSFTYCEV
jgi:hypothetical protein